MMLTESLHADIDLLALHRLAPQRYPMLLESTAAGRQGRWDLLLVADGGQLRLEADGQVRREDGTPVEGGFLDALDSDWQALRLARDAADAGVPFRGGWALLFDYELAGQIEPVLHLPQRADGLPSALALRCPAALLRDRESGRCWAVTEDGHDALLGRLRQDLLESRHLPALPAWQPPVAMEEDPDGQFIDGVRRVIDYLHAGDVFQVNLSRCWQARFERPLVPAALYARLRQANPAPFAGLFDAAGRAVVSSSPERLVSVEGDVVQTRPIAGTRPRFEGDDDAARIRELVGHPKERAEHVMLIDLERNDLGRIAMPGSVEVDELMTVESYAHVHHIVSNVRALLRPEVTPGQVIAATFPGGTITGCPKVRCMEIIAELERTARGAYTGAFGWLNRDGDMDLNILIRTAEVRGDMMRFRTGAGIVVDSDASSELDETRAKARGLLRAL
ncbi:MAG: aminodeoxychorismate synthase component I [Stenotrophomonas nitritireducens]|uniref:aminodeoxychorismate synthase component I n=1 Tax=Stenotrophomonas nitritireducens TaxID=83617 RepID=UPI001AC77662|nr:aminodeoxychorismate synthase component I [Stenotrophomonas nitritireducens]MBN8791143.1 aminodeoxychorismate synthase component I [Stenotrophomonas nitritireducens]MBN8796470.1 aminodeoxychorismate synthase component I [Stenotrophomonas nitritireducens]